jgi:hypothetical protein
VKLAGDPNNAVPFKDDATVEELREEILRRLGELREDRHDRPHGVAGAEASNSELAQPRIDQLGINGK